MKIITVLPLTKYCISDWKVRNALIVYRVEIKVLELHNLPWKQGEEQQIEKKKCRIADSQLALFVEISDFFFHSFIGCSSSEYNINL